MTRAACAPSRPHASKREGVCTDRFGKYRVFIDGVERASGDAKGQLGYLRIPMPEGTVGSRVKLNLDNFMAPANYLNLQYIGVERKWIPMKDAKMSSELPGGFPAAQCLVNNDATPWSLCHTLPELQPWWEASTADGGKYTIAAVVARNRADCPGAYASPRPVMHTSTSRGRASESESTTSLGSS